MKRTIFTENQKKAHDFKRHISVTANAGSGKTTVLANRYINILLNTDTSVEELVAITFTDKAAGELKKKIADTLNNIISFTTDNEIKTRCQKIRSHLALANISTIHSFCAKILRLHPVEANVDVAFTILEGVDKKVLMDEALNESLSEILTNSTHNFKNELIPLLRVFRKKKLTSLINFLIDKREQFERLISENGLYTKSDEEILKYWNDAIINFIITSSDIDIWLHFISKSDSLDENTKNELTNKLNTLKTTDGKNLNFEFVIETFSALKTNLKSKKNLNENFKLLFDKTFKLIDKFLIYDNNNLLLKYTQTLINLYKVVITKYEEKKLENSYLDYEDLQLKTKELLKIFEVRENLSSKFKFIMIDEYQDTNLLQYEIFLPLLDYLKKGNLFIVGDPKQSIFGFRNAEVEVFEKTKIDITENVVVSENIYFDNEILNCTDEEKKGKIILAENFRLLTDIIAFVNLLFSKLMEKSQNEFDVPYQELIKGRANQHSGKVELILATKSDEANQEDEEKAPLDLECEMIARRLVKLKQESYPIYETSFNGEEKARNFDFGDAAILLRSRTYLKKLEYWLNKYKIPYIITGGIGFYQTQEIYDFYNYFQFLLNNHDEAALVGILRSPFFSISDAELYEIAIKNSNLDFWSKVQIYAATQYASDNLKRAVKILSDNIAYAARVPIPILVQKIFRQTGWIGSIAGVQRGEQSKLNVDKLLRISREFEGRGFSNLFDFVERLRNLIETEEKEGQANILTGSKAVHIMTIHSAKGLEFPVVFVPFLQKKFKTDSEPYLDTKFGVAFKIKDENLQEHDAPIFNYIKIRSTMKTFAEEKRLLYVACTRARDLLILSGSISKKLRSFQNHLNYILNSLNINSFNQKEITFPKQKIKSIELCNNKFTSKEFEHDLKIQLITSLNELDISNGFETEIPPPANINQILTQNISAQLRNNIYSATQIQTFYFCPMHYFLKYQLGVPETVPAIYKFNEEEEPNDKIYSEQIGLGVHKVLELFPDYSEVEIKKFLNNFLPAELFNNPEDLSKTINIILEHANNYFNSEIYKKISSYKDFKNEFSLSSKFQEDFITGTMDKIVKDNNGNWIIIDFKTEKVNKENLEQKSKKFYYQIGFYALLVHRMYNQQKVDALIIFTAIKDNNFVKLTFEKSDFQKIEQLIGDAISKITRMEFNLNKEMCDYCSYLKNGKCIGENIKIKKHSNFLIQN